MPSPARSNAQNTSINMQAFATATSAPPPDSEISNCFGAVDTALNQIELLSLELRSRLSPVQCPASPTSKDSNPVTIGPASQFGQALDSFRLRLEAVSVELQDQLHRLAI